MRPAGYVSEPRENHAMVTKKPKGLGLGLVALLGPKVSDTPAPERDGTPSTLKLEALLAGN